MSDRTRGLHQGTANHKPGCACPPCKAKRYEALCLQSKELEVRVLTLTDELSDAKQGAQVLQNALNESRKISQEREKQLAEANQKLSHFMGRTSAAEAYLDTVKAALDCKDPAKLAEKAQKLQSDLDVLKAERTGYETGRRDIQTRLEKALLDLKESQQTSLSLQQDLSKAIADKNMMGGQYEAEFARATGHMHGRTKAEQERDKARAALKLANASIESLKQGSEQLGREVDALTDEVGRLTPLLPTWARIAFAGLGIFLIAYWSHRAGFDAAMALRGGAR